jgi:formylglycine-generating enzyme required for sulfatase activity
MELVPGGDLHRAVVTRPEMRERALSIIHGVGEALMEAHAKGIVHRDVKPANILLDAEGAPRLTDFDLASAGDTTGGTRTGVAMGTYLFTAPEQLHSAKDADARADVFGLGMTAIFCLHGEDLPATAVRRPEEVIWALECSEAVKRVLTRAIELEVAERYEDAAAFCAALREAEPPPRPSPPPPVPFLTHPESALEQMQSKLEKPALTRAHTAALLAFAAVTAGLAGISAWLWPITTPRAGATPSANVVVMPPPPPAPPCPEGMVFVKGDTFLMGSADGDADEKPPHQVRLSPFCLDKTEVTVAAYRQCTKEPRNGVTCSSVPATTHLTGASAEALKFDAQFCNGDKAEKNNHPVNCVDWTHADAYCRWSGNALPTEAQWEYAARGTDGRKYPWGSNEPGAKLLNASGTECRAMADKLGRKGWKVMYKEDDGAGATSPVGAYLPGASPFGALDMAGNVWEWVADWYAPYPASGKATAEDPKGPDKSPASGRVIRGGGWSNFDASWVRATRRHKYDVSFRGNYVGFRCARQPSL